MRWVAMAALALMGAVAAAPALADAGAVFSGSEGHTLQKAERAEANVKILVLHATNEGKGIDKRIGDMPELKKPPLSSYDSYALLDQGALVMREGDEASFDIKANKAKLKVLFSGKKGRRFAVETTITKEDGTKFVSFQGKYNDGEYYFVAGPNHGKGILVLGIRLQAK